MSNYLTFLKDLVIISCSKLFDPDFYLFSYPDVQRSGINPLVHFVRFGSLEGRNPASFFNTTYYLSQNEDVQISGLNPFIHWILHGFYEDRDPSPNYSSPIKDGEFNHSHSLRAWLRSAFINSPKRKFTLKPSLKEISINEEKIILNEIYESFFGKPIDFNNPKTFNEKIQVYKLNYRKSLLTNLTDKLLVRDYVSKKIGNEYLVPIVGHYDKVDNIPFKLLPQKFLLKTSHGSGWNIFCWNRENFNWENAKLTLNYWLTQNYFLVWREWSYKNIVPKILVEELLLDDGANNFPTDFKIYCFNGQPKLVMVRIYENSVYKAIYFNTEWQPLPFRKAYPLYDQPIPKPNNFEEMMSFAKMLAENLPFVRVDMYIINNKIYVGELTFYPSAGFSKFNPPEWDEILGSYFDISMFYP